jgi:cob(I)alamin adenosyltransferase
MSERQRGKRWTWSALRPHGVCGLAIGSSMNQLTATYLNRLSDLVFIVARLANIEHGDVLWKPGGANPEPGTE